MIDRQEIMDFARELALDPKVVEKDYVLGWLLAGIAEQAALEASWVFKGGTCLKKCYFETYRFSEDLDFTITDETHLDQDFLLGTFREICEWIYEQSGIEIPADQVRFRVYDNGRGGRSAEARVYYVGPLQQRRNLMRIKLDLTTHEVLVLDPAIRDVHHPYSDKPEAGINIPCYCFEEVFAEKVRALAERERPRDLYDVVHLYRHDEIRPDRQQVMSSLQEKCAFKSIPVPTRASLLTQSAREKLAAEWEDMLAHQLPVLPSFEQFWDELPMVLDWIHQLIEKPVLQSQRATESIDGSWQPPSMVHAWHTPVPLESVRFAAANHLCVNLQYQGSWRLIEPYSLRRTSEGNILLYAVKHDSGEPSSYRIDRIQGVEISQVPFVPRYLVELTPSSPLRIPDISREISSVAKPARVTIRSGKSPRGPNFGPKHVFQCTACGKKFTHKTYDASLNAHKDKNGYPCYGRFGFHVKTE
ncbi:MAG: nucleotidyl transferase AbiEii/AbiGii toxin family protein [Deltaproteobacteria bacterium]|nr:nucleotidyl transferase AbiEii/AbiGii toxin family protein [Deltaproteobacteria bacterium]